MVIPCHNHGMFIDRAVDSILAQTFGDLEIIIVNDASTDELTNRTLARYAKPKTQVINITAGNASAARNSGIRHARGRYILTLDADDYFRPTFIEKALPILEQRHTVGVVSSWRKNFKDRSDILRPGGGSIFNFLVRASCYSGAIFRRRCWEEVGGYDEALTGYEDGDFWVRITAKGWWVHIIPEPLFCYRVSADSKVNRSNTMRNSLLRSMIANSRKTYTHYIADIVLYKAAEIQATQIDTAHSNRLLRWLNMERAVVSAIDLLLALYATRGQPADKIALEPEE